MNAEANPTLPQPPTLDDGRCAGCGWRLERHLESELAACLRKCIDAVLKIAKPLASDSRPIVVTALVEVLERKGRSRPEAHRALQACAAAGRLEVLATAPGFFGDVRRDALLPRTADGALWGLTRILPAPGGAS